MKPNGKVAVLLVLACTVVGCSKRGERPQAKAEDSKPATPAGEPVAFKYADGEGFDASTAPKVTSSASFADGEAAYQSQELQRRDEDLRAVHRPAAGERMGTLHARALGVEERRPRKE